MMTLLLFGNCNTWSENVSHCAFVNRNSFAWVGERGYVCIYATYTVYMHI